MKTMYVQEVSNAWLEVSDFDTKSRRLIQISKILGVKENPDGSGLCKIVYYNSAISRRDTFYPDEYFEDIVFDIKAVSSGWIKLMNRDTNSGELIQVSKIISVREINQDDLSCEVSYYDVIREEKVSIIPMEIFDEIAKQLCAYA